MQQASDPQAPVSATVCLSDDEAAGFVAGGLDGDARRALAAHVDACERCRRVISAIAALPSTHDGSEPAPQGSAGLRAGQVLGRFSLTRLVGHGSMGEVWAARDAELDREVALKLLRLRPGELGVEATIRLRREAQAMARLSHANVVAIYELGTDGERMFCAMELVDGVTLRRWLETPRAWRAVLGVASAVGTGVAAAHAAGLVHRDIKPENVLIDVRGRAVVSDFGLAKLVDLGTGAGEDPGGSAKHGEDGAGANARAQGAPLGALTATGALLGTPVYMAPEQLAGKRVDARSDQFSYCVTIYEALLGARPFSGATLGELDQAIRRGPPRPAALRGVPAGVVRCLERGLAVEPAARWPSMAVLVDELRRAARRPRQRWIAAGVGAAVAAAAVAIAVGTGRAPDPIEAERAATEQRIATAWSPAKAAAMRAAFAASAVAFAGESANVAIRVLDAYRAEWTTRRLDAWAATHVRHEQTPAILERRMACFDQLAGALDGLVALLSSASPRDVEQAPQIVYRLEPVATCGNLDRLLAQSSAPSTPAGELAERQLHELALLQIAGHHDEALQRAQALVDDAARRGDAAVLARARFELGASQATGGHLVEAEATLRLAIQDAAATRDHYLVAKAWLRLFSLVGLKLHKLPAADAIEPAVRAAVAQAGNDPVLQADLATALGLVAAGRADFAAARDHLIEARDRRIAALGPMHPSVATDEASLGGPYIQLGDLDEAQRHVERALAIMRSTVGDHQPSVAIAEHNLAGIASRRKDWVTTERHARAALEINQVVRGPDHPETAHDRALLADALREQKRYAEARAEFARVRASLARSLPPTHPDVLMIDLYLAEIAEDEGAWDQAVRLARRGVEALRQSDASAHQQAFAVFELARMVGHQAPRDALPIFDDALTLHIQRKERDVHEDMDALRALSETALAAHRPAAALAWFAKLPEAARQLTDLRKQLEATPAGARGR